MPRKIPQHLLQSLWSKQDNQKVKFVRGSRENVLKKTIDNICLSADLSETSHDYATSLCDGMVYLYSVGFRPSDIISHNLLLQKLLNLGRDLMEYSTEDSDVFYLGAFIDIKMTHSWKDLKFFKLLLSMLNKLQKMTHIFTSKIKLKIKQEYQLYYPDEFTKFFILPIKSTA
jgi:hypothetical protein